MHKIYDLSGYRLFIIDMDLTITIPKRPEFYNQYGDKVVEAISEYFDVSQSQALEIANYYRQKCGGGEYALYKGDTHHYFDVPQKPIDYVLLHRKISEIDPTGEFTDQSVLRPRIQKLRDDGAIVVVLTSSPDILANKTLLESGFDPHIDFDAVYAYEANTGPRKITQGSQAFIDVMGRFNCAASETLSIGDSVRHDIDPAIAIGVDAFLISPSPITGYKTIPNLQALLQNNGRKLVL